MAKSTNRKAKPVKQEDPMNGAMKFFLAGCVAELYLLIVRRFYLNGTALQQIAWYDYYLKIFIAIGAVVLVLGAGLFYLRKQDKKKRSLGLIVAACGAFLLLSSAMVLRSMSSLSLLIVVVPVLMIFGLLWSLYDRECALALTLLGASLLALWVCRRAMNSIYLGTYVKIAVVLYIILAAAVALLLKSGKLVKLIPANANPTSVYVASGLSILAMVAALVSTTVAYYVMWLLAVVVFALAVYYTVKQL